MEYITIPENRIRHVILLAAGTIGMNVLALFTHQSLFNVCAMFLVIIWAGYQGWYERKQMRVIQAMISNCEAIIDAKELRLLDGEGALAVLAARIQDLHTRYRYTLDRLRQDQTHMKDYIDNIAHQLKTPLTSMLINEEVLLENDNTPELMAIYRQTQKMSSFIDDLLSLAKLDGEVLTLHFDTYDVKTIMEQAIADLDYFQNVDLTLKMTESYVLCDERWLCEAFKNILKNYIEAKHHIDITMEVTKTALTISFRDDGKGFTTDDLNHLFDRFYTGKQSHGVGIGLSLSRQIIEKHFGLMRAYNAQGACVDVTLSRFALKKSVAVTDY